MSRKNTDVFSKLSKNAKLSLRYSKRISGTFLSKSIEPIHIFLGILINEDSLGSRTVNAMGISIPELIKSLVGIVEIDTKFNIDDDLELNLSESTKSILREAYSLASRLAHVYVGTEHILLSIMRNNESELVKKLKSFGMDRNSFEDTLLNYATYPIGILAKPVMKTTMKGEESILSMFGTDLVEEARKGKIDPVIGREKEIQMIINILSRRKKNNPLIVGEAGVGKTVLVEALAQRIADGNVPQSLNDAKIINLDVSNIMAGSKKRGDVEEKMLGIIREVSTSSNTLLFIDEVHNVLNSGIPGVPSDMSSVLKPALLRGDFRCIGATTSAEYSKYMEEDNALVRRFQPILVEETSIKDTVKILKGIKSVLELHHNVKIASDAIEAAVRLSDRYISDRYLPDKAIDLLDEAAASRKLEVEKEYENIADLLAEARVLAGEKDSLTKKGKMSMAIKARNREDEIRKEISILEKKRKVKQRSKEYSVDVETVKEIVSKWSGIPVTTIGKNERLALLNLEKVLSSQVVGQEEAVKAVSSAIKRARTGISDDSRPWASFLFLGPTGVGKTELAKVLTKELFGDENRLIQIDMSEMMEMHSVSKLIGSPPGYVGYREGGQLTERIRRQPHSVILFDEIEKAHVDVLNILLQIFEYGHLTDGKGNKVNFKNTVIILTSNIGAEEIKEDKVLGFIANKDVGKSDEDIDKAYGTMKDTLMRKLKDVLRPELLNRLDDVVIFRSLTRKDALRVVDLLIVELNKRIRNMHIKIDVDENMRKRIVKEGFSEEYGARPLRRMVQDFIENALANYMLKDKEDVTVSKKMRILKVGFLNGDIVIK